MTEQYTADPHHDKQVGSAFQQHFMRSTVLATRSVAFFRADAIVLTASPASH